MILIWHINRSFSQGKLFESQNFEKCQYWNIVSVKWQQIALHLRNVELFPESLQICTKKICSMISMKNVFQNLNIEYFILTSSVRFILFFYLFLEIKHFLKITWLTFIDRFDFRIDLLMKFCRKGKLRIKCSPWSSLCSVPLLFLRNKSFWLRSQKEFLTLNIVLRSKDSTFSQSFFIYRMIKDFWLVWIWMRNFGWKTIWIKFRRFSRNGAFLRNNQRSLENLFGGR